MLDGEITNPKYNNMQRRDFLKTVGIAGGAVLTSSLWNNAFAAEDNEFPLYDLHTHLTDTFTIEKVMEIAEKTKVKFGIVAHPIEWGLKDDEALKKYIAELRKYPVYIGLQPVGIGWYKNYSAELLSQIDYILMDPQMVPMGNGVTLHIWEFDTYIEDTEEFMQKYMDYALNILKNEPINIFAWPLFLPVCIARDYYSLWTEERMQQILTAAKARNIAIEINDMAHTPHEKFIHMAKEQGLKFTFGSDSRNMIAGKLNYCKAIAKKCGLKRDDFYFPDTKKHNGLF